jgi:hypothetical protein
MTETSRLIVGSTGSGKSEGELVDLVRLAEGRSCAVVLLDGHGPLAMQTAGHWEARGLEGRMVYEPLKATDRALCWDMLPRSTAATAEARRLEDAETRDEVAQCFLAERDLETLRDRPWTKDWLEAAIALCLAQPQPEPLTSLLAAFHPGSADYRRLLSRCRDAAVIAKFTDLDQLRRRSPTEYERQTGPARRLIELICTSEVVRLRCRPGPFDWLAALRQRRLIAFDGGGIRSTEIKRTLFLLVSMAVIQAVRRHFAAAQQPLPVVLVLEEAGALELITPFVLSALQELRKAGLALHVITQSSGDFGDPGLLQSVLANAPWQAWYQCLSPADQELGARALVNAAFEPLAVHFNRRRQLHDGTERRETVSRGESFDQHGETIRRDRREGGAFLPRFREVTDEHYKTPQHQEQEFRTGLATHAVGERFVRDRRGVRRERVTMLGPSRPLGLSRHYALDAIGRVRRQPIYLPPPAADAGEQAGGAAALLGRGGASA